MKVPHDWTELNVALPQRVTVGPSGSATPSPGPRVARYKRYYRGSRMFFFQGVDE